MKRNVSCKKMLFCAFISLVGWSSLAQAEDMHINFAAFQKTQPGFEFSQIVDGKFSDFIQAMEGSQILILSHTSHAVDNDVLNFQQDVLRETKDGMKDDGINCSLSLHIDGKGTLARYSVGGLCKIFRTGDASAKKITAVIPSTSLPDTSQGFEGWIELYEDKTSGIAFYANVSTDH